MDGIFLLIGQNLLSGTKVICWYCLNTPWKFQDLKYSWEIYVLNPTYFPIFLATSPPSHLSYLISLPYLSHLSTSLPSHLSHLATSLPSHLSHLTSLPSTNKALQNNNIKPSVSPHNFLTECPQYQNFKANSCSPSQETVSDSCIWCLVYWPLDHWDTFKLIQYTVYIKFL